jgi:hypothetical protein
VGRPRLAIPVTDAPDDALIEAIAAAIDGARIRWYEDEANLPPECVPLDHYLARAAYAAIVDHLGLEWWNSVKDMLAREPYPRRRLMSKWHRSQPARCGAEQNTANLPANNPPHVCVDEDPDHWPLTKHHDSRYRRSSGTSPNRDTRPP